MWRPLGHWSCLWPWHNIVAAASASGPGLHGGGGGLDGLVIVECLRDFAFTSELRSSTSPARVSSALIDRTVLHAAGAPPVARGTTRHPIHQIFTCLLHFLNQLTSLAVSSRYNLHSAHCHVMECIHADHTKQVLVAFLPKRRIGEHLSSIGWKCCLLDLLHCSARIYPTIERETEANSEDGT